MQSPGSNGYDPSWSHVYSYDITDFAHLLKDSVEIDVFIEVGLVDLQQLILSLLKEYHQEMY